MATIFGRTLTASGAYLIKRARTLAARLIAQRRGGATHEIIHGYLLRATARGNSGMGLVIDPPGGLLLSRPGSGVMAVATYQPRDWYNSQYEIPAAPVAFGDLPLSETGQRLYSLYDSPPAPVDGADTLFPVFNRPWRVAATEGADAVTAASAMVIDTPSNVKFKGAPPFGLSATQAYGVEAHLHQGSAPPMVVQITARYLDAHIAPGWRFGPYLSRLVDLRCGAPMAAAVRLRPHSTDMAVVGTTYRYPGTLPAPAEFLTHPKPGLFVLCHSRQQMLEAWTASSNQNQYEDGLLWHRHIDLATTFPLLDTAPYICTPFANDDYVLTGGGDPNLASEAYKVWISGHYTGGTPPTNIGKLPAFLTRLCAVSLDESIHVLAGVTFFRTVDRHALGYEDTPLFRSHLFCCTGLLRLELSHAGEVLVNELVDLDSTAGPGELAADGLPGGRHATRTRVVEPCALLVHQGQLLELTAEWADARENQARFNSYPLQSVSTSHPLLLEHSGLRLRWGTKNLFFPIATTGLTPWSKSRWHPNPLDYYYVRGLSSAEAPGAVSLSATEVAFVAFRLTADVGRMVLCVVDLETDALSVRSEVAPDGGQPVTYLPPPYPNEGGASMFQQPPVLSVAQQTIRHNTGEVAVEGVLFLSFGGARDNAWVSRDSGRTWSTLVTGAKSQAGVFYAANALRPDYTTGSAAVSPIE